jgi:tRNA A-37 threonylcarbamoyl transferase component Bud32
VTATASTVIGDRYRLDERIAVGGMGEVWRGRDTVLDRDVAVKILRSEFVGDASSRERFRDEARHTAALTHPGIAAVFDYGEFEERPYLVMELVQGEPLSAAIQRDGALPADRALDIVGQAALALQAAHDAGVVHRDVKPGNLLICPDGTVKVTDFGIARAAESAAPATATGLVVGTAAYLSPEQASGIGAGPASDIYALGVVGYECLTGARPFGGDSAVAVATAHVTAAPPALPASVPPLVADFIMRALEKDPARRQPSAGDFGRTALALAAELRAASPGASAAAPEAEDSAAAAAPATAVGTPFTAVSGAASAATGGASDGRRRLAILLAAGVLGIVVLVLLLRSCGGGTPTLTRVPDERGKTYSAAANELKNHGLIPTRTNRHNPTVPAGTIVTQRPAAGARLPAGRPVLLVVSTGPRAVQLNAADFIGRPAADVVRELQSMGFHVVTMSSPSTAPAGTVTAVDPTGSVPRGATVNVTVAAPPAPPAKKPEPKPKPPKPPKPHDH